MHGDDFCGAHIKGIHKTEVVIAKRPLYVQSPAYFATATSHSNQQEHMCTQLDKKKKKKTACEISKCASPHSYRCVEMHMRWNHYFSQVELHFDLTEMADLGIES